MPALKSALVKFKPRSLSKNPVMFVTAVVAALSTLLFVRDAAVGAGTASVAGQIAAWLWFTVYFANFAEALAEGRGKARADTLRATQTETPAKRLASLAAVETETVSSRDLRPGDLVLVEAGDIVPADGEVVEGIATIDEIRDHRRIRAGDPRIRRRSFGGHRRHPPCLRLDQGARHLETRRELPRPHDRAWSKAPSARRRRTRSRSTSCWSA